MRTKKIPLLLAIAALGLASCGGGEDSSELTADSEEASTSETVTDSATSGDPDETSSTEDPIATSSEEEAGWPTDEIAEALTSIVGYTGDIAIPTPSDTLTEGHTFTVDTSLAWNGTTDRIIAITATGEFDGGTYIDEAVATEDWLEPSMSISGCEFAHSTDEALQIVVYDYDSTADTTLIYISAASWGYYAVWPEATLDDWVQDVAENNDARALPTVDDSIINIVVLDEYTEATYGDYFDIYVYATEDFSDAYTAALTAAGFVPFGTTSTTFYADPNWNYYVQVSNYYFSSYGYIYIGVTAISAMFYLDSEAEDVDYVGWYYSNALSNGYLTESLPSCASLGYDLAYVTYGYNSSYQGIVQLWFWEFDEDWNAVDLSEEFIDLMDASDDWYKYSDGIYLAANTGYAAVYIYGPTDCNASLLVQIVIGNYSSYLPSGE